MERQALGFELVEQPPFVEERSLDHRVTLKGRESVVKPLDGDTSRIPRRGYT